jgi:uncharacterized protein (DUF302 family)
VLPIRVYVFENQDGRIMVGYDRPSATLEAHPSEKVRAFGRLLDDKMQSIVHQATMKGPQAKQ